MRARLLLQDGTLFTGTSFGAEGETIGEVVFNTSMTGYQEVLTDPSYCGQIVTMTYPLIGNYGFARDDNESLRPYAHGFIVREHAEFASNWRNEATISQWLKEYGIIGISGIDTRMLTRKLRLHGTMRGLLTTGNESTEELLERLNQAPVMHDQVARVSIKDIHISPNVGKRVVLVDFGAKHNIQRELVERGCEVVSVPYNTTAEEILRFRPDGVMLSNGPGDPKDVPEAIRMIQKLLGRVPIFGICLGHQLFALACGANTEKLKFGHRGGNHPVKELATGRTVITAQNHGYAVSSTSVEGTDLTITHIALNDGTVEGLEHKKLPAFSVQYHPESAPGPLDSGYLFDRFIDLMESFAKKGETVYA
jgi:carbamoyl-phosphate synthase small subunit